MKTKRYSQRASVVPHKETPFVTTGGKKITGLDCSLGRSNSREGKYPTKSGW